MDTTGRRRRVFNLEDSNAYVDSLDRWKVSCHAKGPGSRKKEVQWASMR